MILEHIAELAGLVEIAPAPLDPDLLRHRNLDVIDGVVVPVGGEDGIGKAQRKQVQHRFLAEIVVDAVDLPLVENSADRIIDDPGGGEIGADGLFKHHPGPLRGQPCRGKPLADRAEEGRRHGEIIDHFAPVLIHLRLQAAVLVGLGQVDLHITQSPGEAFPYRGIDRLGHEVLQTLMGQGDVALVIGFLPRHPDDGAVRGNEPYLLQLVQ